MSLFWRKTYILAAIETTYGVDEVPSGANAIKIRNANLVPLAGNTEDRGLLKPKLGASPKVPVSIHRKTDFEVEVAGSGAAGDVPGWGVLARMCGLDETVTAATKVEYTPISTGFESASLYYYKDNQLRKLLGARGTFGMSFQAGNLPHFKVEGLGLWSAASEPGTIPAPGYTGFADGIPVSKNNTPIFTLFGHALVMKSLEMNLGSATALRDLVNFKEIALTDRQTTGSVVFEWPPIATFDPEAVAQAGTTGALQLVHGTTAGNIIQIDAPAVQITEPAMVEDQGVTMCQCTLTFTAPQGDDEFVITAK
ncbi:MAG: hypothetical protein HQL34_11530 [Alphaproteobacteria bacterium]|nr:hypothetical protein [Alphaproteobacteria bacterium]